MSELVVYTAITGKFGNKLRPPQIEADPKGRRVRFVAFVSRDHPNAGPWEQRSPVWEHHRDARRTARWHKLHPHKLFPEADYTLWIDGNQQAVINPWQLVDHYLSGMVLASYKHPERDCIYDELEACVRRRKDDEQVMRGQVEHYRRQGYPAHRLLIETTVLLRPNTDLARDLNERWWEELRWNSLRDQLSLPYVLWRMGQPYSVIPGRRDKPQFFRYHPHR